MTINKENLNKLAHNTIETRKATRLANLKSYVETYILPDLLRFAEDGVFGKRVEVLSKPATDLDDIAEILRSDYGFAVDIYKDKRELQVWWKD